MRGSATRVKYSPDASTVDRYRYKSSEDLGPKLSTLQWPIPQFISKREARPLPALCWPTHVRSLRSDAGSMLTSHDGQNMMPMQMNPTSPQKQSGDGRRGHMPSTLPTGMGEVRRRSTKASQLLKFRPPAAIPKVIKGLNLWLTNIQSYNVSRNAHILT